MEPPMLGSLAAPVGAQPPTRFARGWHCLGLADEYRDGKPHRLDLFGTRLVAYSGEDGHIHILDAWCPHMGADLSMGLVSGHSLICPFHAWSWGADGACDHIPYSKRIPPKARIKSWPTLEENKLLFVWNDPEGHAPPEDVRIPRLEQAFSDQWSDWSIVRWTIDNNCRELVDNLADMSHFQTVHFTKNVMYFANVFEGHKATQIMLGYNDRLDTQKNNMTSISTYFGPAYHITSVVGEMQGFTVEFVMLNAHVPIDANRFELRFGVMVRKNPAFSEEVNRAMVPRFVETASKAFYEDVAIWHNKVRVDKPLLCEGDGPIHALRRWYEQFYVDAGKIDPEAVRRQVIEVRDLGVENKPPLRHVFGL